MQHALYSNNSGVCLFVASSDGATTSGSQLLQKSLTQQSQQILRWCRRHPYVPVFRVARLRLYYALILQRQLLE